MPGKMHFETVSLASLNLTGGVEARAHKRRTILIVDDEAVIADTLGMILELNGFRVVVAYDGQSALKISRTVPPDLLLTDVSMAGMSGIDLAIEMQRLLPACKVLLFSGQASTSDLLNSARLTGADFTILAKPLHPTELLIRLSDALASQTAHPPFVEKNTSESRQIPA